MFGAKGYGANVYAQMGLETGVVAASPNQLVIMLYEGAISAAKNAIVHMKNKEIELKGEMISKATLIIESGLRASLDKKVGGTIAENLDSLYLYMTQRLMMANLHNRPELIEEVVKLLSELKFAWESIDAKSHTLTNIDQVMNVNPRMANDRLVVGA
jgi:flagellar secretion chaperone FliS